MGDITDLTVCELIEKLDKKEKVITNGFEL